jgi:hypothetical protein
MLWLVNQETDPLTLRGGEEQGLDQHLHEFVEKYAATVMIWRLVVFRLDK